MIEAARKSLPLGTVFRAWCAGFDAGRARLPMPVLGTGSVARAVAGGYRRGLGVTALFQQLELGGEARGAAPRSGAPAPLAAFVVPSPASPARSPRAPHRGRLRSA
jgi:hypothetical protein